MKPSPIVTIVQAVREKQSSALEQVEMALAKVEENQPYNAVISVGKERALAKAQAVDDAIACGSALGPLVGVPFIAKDNIVTHDSPSTAASKILENFTSPLQATVIDKLEAAGAICIGKANLDAFGHGGSTENSAFGPTKNAYDMSRVAGGSSGGSAVAVALGIVPFSIGSDTGGSVRQPASFNNVIGFKPTYGLVSRFGLMAMISSSDCIAPVAKTAGDTELIMQVIAGHDQRDSVTLNDGFEPLDDFPRKLKIGVIKECQNQAVDKEVAAKMREYTHYLNQAGHDVGEISLPTISHSLAMYYIIGPAEISSNLSRYDGIRYGVRAPADTLAQLYAKSRDQGFGVENERRILIGSYVLSSGYYDAYYQQAQKARTLLINDFQKAFKTCDVLLCPTAPTPAFKIGEKNKNPLQMYLADVMTVAPSLAGLPAISVPAGMSTKNLPIGMQFIGPALSDSLLLGLAKQMEGKI